MRTAAALCATVALAGCTPAPPNIPRAVASCELDGVRLYRNPATRDDRVGEFILTCMRSKGLELSFDGTPCESTMNLRDPKCYRPATP